MVKYNIILLMISAVYINSDSYNIRRSCIVYDEKSECVPLLNCTPLVDFILNLDEPVAREIKLTLQYFVCDYAEDPLDITVCCPSIPINIDQEGNLITPPAPPPEDVTDHENFKYLPEDCGTMTVTLKVVGGENAKMGEFPWMALLLHKEGDNLINKCGGTILNEYCILTAAHCMTSETLPVNIVRIGEYRLSSEKDCLVDEPTICSEVQDLKLERKIIHPEYDADSAANDIALLRVEKMNLTEISPICLPTHAYEDKQYMKTRSGTVTGWGNIDEHGTKADILQRVDQRIRDMSVCAKAYLNDFKIKVYSNSYKRLCIGGNNKKDSCGGDSGGPFQTHEYLNDDDRFVQRGIVSLGYERCGTKGKPAIFTNVEYYLKWILDNISP